MTRSLRLGILMTTVGLIGILVSTFADLIGLGKPGIGLDQMSIMIIGALVAMVGLVKVLFPDNRILLQVLTWIYLSGILLAGLMPFGFHHTHSEVFLSLSIFDWRDFALNVVGFVLLGYLLMMSIGNQQNEGRDDLIKQAIVVSGVGCFISLLVEASQYHIIPGRLSSFWDLMANTMGTVAGVALCLFTERQGTEGIRYWVGVAGERLRDIRISK